MQGDGMKKNRMTYLDMAKGIGILFMIVGHTISLGWQKDLIYSFHMPLFFVCSGMTMVLSNNWLEWREDAKKSAKRLLLPALVLFMVMTLWTYLVEGKFAVGYSRAFDFRPRCKSCDGKWIGCHGLWKRSCSDRSALVFAGSFLCSAAFGCPPCADAEEMGKPGYPCLGTGSYPALSLPLALDLGLAGIGLWTSVSG